MARHADPSNTRSGPTPGQDRSSGARIWYRLVQGLFTVVFAAFYSLRATGRGNVPRAGPALLVSNHLSFLDSIVLGILLPRPINYVARSTLFLPGLGAFIRSVGGFPIQREGLGASGMKETLRRLRSGGVVALFPEGTRTETGELGEVKDGISVLAVRSGVPIIPAAIAGTFEAWPRSRPFPSPHPLRVHYGPPILPDEVATMETAAVTRLIRDRMLACQRVARAGLAGDLGDGGLEAPTGVGGSAGMG